MEKEHLHKKVVKKKNPGFTKDDFQIISQEIENYLKEELDLDYVKETIDLVIQADLSSEGDLRNLVFVKGSSYKDLNQMIYELLVQIKIKLHIEKTLHLEIPISIN